MVVTEVVNKDSIIKFEDKHTIVCPTSGMREFDGEDIMCKIPELDLGESIVLNGWGYFETFQNGVDERRRRLGVYSVASKENGNRVDYVLKMEVGFSESELARKVLSGNSSPILKDIKDLKYVELDRDGRLLS